MILSFLFLIEGQLTYIFSDVQHCFNKSMLCPSKVCAPSVSIQRYSNYNIIDYDLQYHMIMIMILFTFYSYDINFITGSIYLLLLFTYFYPFLLAPCPLAINSCLYLCVCFCCLFAYSFALFLLDSTND